MEIDVWQARVYLPIFLYSHEYVLAKINGKTPFQKENEILINRKCITNYQILSNSNILSDLNPYGFLPLNFVETYDLLQNYRMKL